MLDWLQLRGAYIAGICLFWIGYIFHQKSIKRLRFWGLTTSGFKPSVIYLAPFVVGIILFTLMYAFFDDRLVLSWHLLWILLLYPLWGFLQQFLMLGIILQNLLQLLDERISRTAIYGLVAMLFSCIHYPSLFLMIFAFILEAILIAAYIKWRNLWAIGIAHGITATIVLFYVQQRDLWVELFAMF